MRVYLVTEDEELVRALSLLPGENSGPRLIESCASLSEANDCANGEPSLILIDESLPPGSREDFQRLVKAAGQSLVLLVAKIKPEKPADHREGTADSDNLLTQREIEILRRVGQGQPNHLIASEMHLSTNSIKFHLKRCMEKLSARDRCQAVVEAMRRGCL